MSNVWPVDDASILQASEFLKAGKLVAFPTETVYGLGADASNDRAIASIYAAKGRPSFNPLIIHVDAAIALNSFVHWTDCGKLLSSSFWPGPLTLVLPRRSACGLSLLASSGLDTLAVRVPAHPVAQALLRSVKMPIAAPSANASGSLSPTAPIHVVRSLGSKVDLILAGGRVSIGLESTVVDVTGNIPVILRPGAITLERLEQVLGTPVASASNPDMLTVRSPGTARSHYAPQLPLRTNAAEIVPGEAFLAFGPQFPPGAATMLNLSKSADLDEAAANLFAMLHELDDPRHSGIAVASIPNYGLGVAINDRLQRACVR